MGALWEQFGRYFDYILEALWGYVLNDFWKVPRMIWGLFECFFLVLSPSFHLLRRGRGRAARRGRRPLDLIGPSSDAVVMLVLTFLCPPLFLLVATAATAFENMPLQCSSFKRASRSLAKTGL